MDIFGREIDINVREEIEGIVFEKAKIKGNELLACSPFRNEIRPSFSLNLDSGLWIDRGAMSDSLKQGNIIKLLALINGETFEDVSNYLIDKYSTLLEDTDGLELKLELELDSSEELTPQNVLSKKVLNFKKVSKYLSNRNISVEIQELFETGYDEDKKLISLVWRNKKGNIANIKYRSTVDKKFFYENNCEPIHDNVYGIYQIDQLKAEEVWICESEIDALTLWSVGIPAIALGGSNLNEIQKDIIIASSIKRLVIATDNDRVGNALRELLKEQFLPHLKVYDIEFPLGKKDINDLSKGEIEKLDINKVEVTLNFML